MKTSFPPRFLAAATCVVLAGAQMLFATEPPGGLGLPNGSFESDFDQWTTGGNVSIQSAAPYAPTDGSKLAAFNAVNTAPNGWISQNVPVANTVSRYHRLKLDVGNLGFVSMPMSLRVQITETLDGVLTTRVDQVVTVSGITGGATHWQEAAFVFPNPVTGQVEIKLSDVSAGTSNADLVVDHLRIDEAAFLTTGYSDDTYAPGLPVTVSPASVQGWTNGATPVSFQYFDTPTVTLTAPATSNGRPFLHWLNNGIVHSTNHAATVTINGDTTMLAVYDPPYTLQLSPPDEIRTFVATGPFSSTSWLLGFYNESGNDVDWSAAAELPSGSPDPVFFKVIPSHGTMANNSTANMRVVLTDAARDLPAGIHRGKVVVHSSQYADASVEVTLRVIDPAQHLVNPSFESDFDLWQTSGNVSIQSAVPYTPTDGAKAAAFNTENSTPNGSVAQVIPTEYGVSYDVSFDMGVLSFNTNAQNLMVEAAFPGNPPQPYAGETFTVHGVADGHCHWQRLHYHFMALSDQTLLTFRDVSSTSGSIDLLLDHIIVSNPDFGLLVTTASDENDPSPGMGSGDSLREVIQQAAAMPGSHAIGFAPGLEGGTLVLDQGELHVTSPIAINSWNANTVISGGDSSRVMKTESQVSLRNLTITNGNASSAADLHSGGGILNTDSLVLTDVTFSNNHAPDDGGALFAWGKVLASGCRFIDNHAHLGGAVYNTADSLFESCLLTDNSASADGGAFASGAGFGSAFLMVTGSTIASNTAAGSGGGYAGLYGYKVFGTLYADNSTFAGNACGSSGGAVFGQGSVTLDHCTVSNNSATGASSEGGGVANATLATGDSIISNNHAPSHPDLASDASGSSLSEFAPNLIGGNAMLSNLGSYGGSTPTMIPLSGSPALDGGAAYAGESFLDQRETPRVQGGAPDLGAVEVRSLIVNTAVDETDGIESGDISMRDALAAQADIIRFVPGLDGGVLSVWAGPLVVNHPTDISASDLESGLTISANHHSSVLEIGTEESVTISGLTITDGLSSGDGGGIRVNSPSQVVLRHCSIERNHATGAGGALWNSGNVTLDECEVFGNTAGTHGGALATVAGSQLHVDRSFVHLNHADGNGGALWSSGSLIPAPIYLHDSTVSENSADGSGGGYSGNGGYHVIGTLSAVNSTFCGNSAAENGGAINMAGNVRLIHCTLSGNSATGATSQGGGLYGSGPSIGNTIIAGNSAAEGPDVFLTDFNQTLDALAPNQIGGSAQLAGLGDYGGATPTMPPLPGSPAIDGGLVTSDTPGLDQRGEPRVSGSQPDIGAVEEQEIVVDTLADENDGPETGGVSLRDALTSSSPTPPAVIRFNPSLNGGTIVLSGAPLEVTHMASLEAGNLAAGITVTANHLSRVFEVHSAAAMTNLTIADGNATGDGGGILVPYEGGNLVLSHCRIQNNTATGNGGGVACSTNAEIRDSRVAGNHADLEGGGTFNQFGNLAVLRSLVTQNTSNQSGGGLACRGIGGQSVLTLTDSTVSNNTADTVGGGYSGSLGYKIWGNLQATNSTLSGNTASGGGGICTNGTVHLFQCTVSNNNCPGLDGSGGGIATFDNITDLELTNSIAAGNSSAYHPNVPPTWTLPIDPAFGANLVDGDPKLAPLDDYGGPTPTMPPLPGSPAIDSAMPLAATPTSDQRGAARPSGPAPDIGAVEAFAFSSLSLVDTDHDGIDDRLEPAYQLTVGVDDSAKDSDGDGSTDADEIANMTDPRDSSSYLRIHSITALPDGHTFHLIFPTFPGLSYSLECDQNLDFNGPDARIVPFGTAAGTTGEIDVELMQGRDFVRVRRNP